MKPYICEGTIVYTKTGKVGKVCVVDRDARVFLARTNKSYFADKFDNIVSVSHKEVE